MIYLETWCRQRCTIGVLGYDDWQCMTLELPWKDNRPDVSCIPAGVYRYERMVSPSKGREVLRLLGVADRTLINIENGNYTRQLLGCIFVGKAIQPVDGDLIPDVSGSVKTLEALIRRVPQKGRIAINRSGLYPR